MKVLTCACALALLVIGMPNAGAAPSYLPPVVANGMTFPVARTNWYSVINFKNDWHAPRMRFVGGKWRQIGVHEGNDVFAEPGTPVLAVVPGRVEQVGWTFYSGWRVGIRDAAGRYWFYAHLRRFSSGIAIGQAVQTGTLLGQIGNTGYGDEPGHHDEFTYHLHLGIQEADGRWVNPYPVLRALYKKATKN